MPQGFVVAMRAQARCCRPGQPWLSVPEAGCWLLVTRSGRHGEFLAIGHAGGPSDGVEVLAPHGLTPRASCLGLLGPQAPGPAGFLLQHDPMPDLQLGGCFVPASGVAWVEEAGGRLRLSLLGRIAGGADCPWQAGTWRLEAVQAPWIGELLAP